MQPEPVMGPLTWCHDCLWQEGETREIEVLEYSYDSYTPKNELEFIEVVRTPCGCDPEDYDDEAYEPSPPMGTTIKAGWRCAHCKLIQQEYAKADKCCGNVIRVPKGMTVKFLHSSYTANRRDRFYIKESDFTIEDKDGNVVASGSA